MKTHILVAFAALFALSAIADQEAQQEQNGLIATQMHQLGPVQGLQNAMVMVQNENAASRLQANLERWVEKHNATLAFIDEADEVELIEEGEQMRIRAKERIKFMWMELEDTQEVITDAEGNTVEERHNWVHRVRSLFKRDKTA